MQIEPIYNIAGLCAVGKFMNAVLKQELNLFFNSLLMDLRLKIPLLEFPLTLLACCASLLEKFTNYETDFSFP